ncbi:MAG: galactokinase [Chloroflexota bacterium]|nr:galactokinase [Chloroflexota bacterium]
MTTDLIDMPQPHDLRVETVIAAFQREFGRPPEGIVEAPARVNLIGEHVDYNDGLVLPSAINRSVMAAWAHRDDDAVWAYSADYAEHSRFNLSNITHAASGAWANYVRGVASVLRSESQRVDGIGLAIAGSVPQGAGLSSSAAIEVAVAGAFRDAFALPIDDTRLAQLCQRAENEFVGVRSGIMDQFASMMSKRDHALLVDCRTLAYEQIPLRLGAAGLSVVIANSAVPRELISSAYNDRRRECEAAVVELRERLHRPELASLRDVTQRELEQALQEGEAVALRRARHVIGEIARVAAAVEALQRDDFSELGRLMQESHQSLRDDYEVSSPELDLLVGLATARDYVVGARLTGAGFGGCTVNLVHADSVHAFARDVIAPFRQRTGRAAEIYVTPACDGLRTWRL